MRIRGQGREVLPPRPGVVVPPVGGVGAVGVWGRGGAGVVAGGVGERGEARGQGRPQSTAGGGVADGSSGRSEGSRVSVSSVCGLESGMTHIKRKTSDKATLSDIATRRQAGRI